MAAKRESTEAVGSVRELGDFQTPAGLVEQVLNVVWHRRTWGRVLEPTCGLGNFLAAAAERSSGTIEFFGLDLQPAYVAAARERLRDVTGRVRIEVSDIFRRNMADLVGSGEGPLLVLGNPPWVTNAAQGAVGAENLPRKSNFKRLSGFDAQTGAANFDIAEYIILKLVTELKNLHATVALLCKTLVARNVLEYAARASLPLSNAGIYVIDARLWFGASVDACLFVFDIAQGTAYEACLYPSLSAAAPSGVMRVEAGKLVGDASEYNRARIVEGQSPFEWRQGVKHDAAAVMELSRRENGVFENGLGESVDVEPPWVFPLLKSSDVFNGRVTDARGILITQTALTDDTASLRRKAPRLWAYLESHRAQLDGRKSRIYHARPQYSIFGVGPYSFAPYKVLISGLYKTPRFTCVGPIGDRPVIADDTCYFLPFERPESASAITALLRSDIVSAFLRSVSFTDAKRVVTKRLLQRIDLSAVAATVPESFVLAAAAEVFCHLTGRALQKRLIRAELEGLAALQGTKSFASIARGESEAELTY